MARPSRLYLLSYNSLQSLGWFLALLRLLPCLAPPHSLRSAYAVAGDLICALLLPPLLSFPVRSSLIWSSELLYQYYILTPTASQGQLLLMPFGSGLVPTAPLAAFLQWGGRTHFVLAIVRQIPGVESSPSVFITFMAWSISEVICYSHYALTALKVCPSWLTCLRFHCFYPLYPIGVGPGEMWTMYQALPFVKERNLYSGFFQKFSMSYHSFLMGVLVCYPFLWLKLYLHVFKQRKSKLGKVNRKKRAWEKLAQLCSGVKCHLSPACEMLTARCGLLSDLAADAAVKAFAESTSNLLYYKQFRGFYVHFKCSALYVCL
ncbi:uncharacterized protein LOC133884105 [Phragmites australis]|uniref:uncharacterized protein LOC133884105 n=1 Tax=Phragmites australis TaxID=29695 RepID=UPI002D78BB32|nr:uncharacterized protein LOC133884105 [Phragmites australis]